MKKSFKLVSGSSTKNSVSFFLKESYIGIEAVRQEDGSIVTKEVNRAENMKKVMKFIKVILICSIFREITFLLDLPRWFYHASSVFWVALFLIGILSQLADREACLYHGAEHKVSNWYSKKNRGYDIEGIKKCSRIHSECGTNLVATVVTFQVVSSIAIEIFGLHIPEIITGILPIFVYNIFPFNFLGILLQLITTAPPDFKHITVAVKALSTLIAKESESESE